MTPIEEKLAQLATRGIDLGVALSFEIPTFDGGTLQDFDFGTIYFHPTVGAFLCQGEILTKYREILEIQSGLGYPITDTEDDPFVLLGKTNDFEFGAITASADFGVSVRFTELVTIPQVVVKLHDNIPLTLGAAQMFSLNDLVFDIGAHGGEFVIPVIQTLFPDLLFRRTFDSLNSQQILDLVARAQEQDPTYAPPNFDNFLEIDCPVGFNTVALADALRAWTGVVERAYTAPTASDPVVGTTNPRFTQQKYLDPAPVGISVQAAWAKGADGVGQNFVDIEGGWLPGHEDLPTSRIQLVDGRMDPKSIGHGTAVLGEIVALDNTTGVVGIAPGTTISLLSRFVSTNSDRQLVRGRVADMVLKTATLLSVGGVVLLEVQFNDLLDPDRLMPVETDFRVRTAIKLITRLGIVVVEAGGNAGDNLDTFVDDAGRNVLNRASSDFDNSGAIMVAACQSATPSPTAGHARHARSNFGSRMDVYAWGENITTTGTKSFPVREDSYMNDMSGTSGASAIIAGVCLLIQHLQGLLTPVTGITGPLRPEQMLVILRNPANGTRSPDRIGTMPDFKKIIANEYLP